MSITPLCYTDLQRCEFTSSPGSQFNQLAVACAAYPVQFSPALWSTFAVNRYRNGTALECVPASPYARIGQSAAHQAGSVSGGARAAWIVSSFTLNRRCANPGPGFKFSGSERAPRRALLALWASRFPFPAPKAPRGAENLHPSSLTRDWPVLHVFRRI